MRRLRVTIFFGGFTIGGGQNVVYESIKNIDQSQVDLTVICYEGKANTTMEQEAEKSCSIVYLNEKGKVTLAKARRIFAALKATKPDVVHVHLGGMVYAVPWALLHSTPLLITAHTKPEQAFPHQILPLIKWGIRRKKIRIAAVSKENLAMMQNYFQINDERLSYVNNGIDLQRYYGKQHELFTFINVARQDANKNQAQIIRCFAEVHKKHPNTRLLLVGDGPCHQSLKELVQEMGMYESIDVVGMRSNVEDYYAISDVYVQASHREALPMSALEAMASGLPIISTDVGGMRDIVSTNGYLIPDNDSDALIRSMLSVLGLEPSELARMKQQSLANVCPYSADQMAKAYMHLYRDMYLTK